MSNSLKEGEIQNYLQGKGIPQFIDKFVRHYLEEQPDDFKPMLKQMLQQEMRTTGKGQKVLTTEGGSKNKSLKYSPDGEPSPPDYCMRDPRIRPSEATIERKGVVEWPETRSKILDPHMNKDYASTVAAQFNEGAAACQVVCRKIKAECDKQQKPFFDNEFYFGRRNTMYPKGAPEDCTVTEPVKAMRASELYPDAPLFASGVGSNDIVQGAVGDCFYIGAVSALATAKDNKLKPLERLFVYHDIKWGIYGVCFFKNGEWEWVIVDDWIAVSQAGRDLWPQYAAPGSEGELWPMIIEKAYAKMHFCWDAIDGGWSRQALEDLTGGLAYTLNLYKQDRETLGGPNYKGFMELANDPYIVLGCSVGWHVADAAGAGRAGEQGAVHGLFKGHAYSVIQFAETSDRTGFVRVRNPWGNEAEWKGRYGDGTRDWDRNPLHKRELNPEFKDDGAFWMTWEDFRTIFTDIDVVRFFPYTWCVLSMVGRASKKENTEKNTFIFKVSKPVQGLVFSMGQDDPLTSENHQERKNGRLAACKLSLFKLKREPRDMDDLQGCLGEKISTAPARDRSLFHSCDLQPGLYSLVPQFRDAQKLGYYTRIFTPPDADVTVWRFSTPLQKWSTALAKEVAGSVPACAVPHDHEAGHQKEEAQENQSVVTVRGGPKTPELALCTIGCRDQRQYDDILTNAFNQADVYNRGQLSVVHAREALQHVIADSPVVENGFNKKWTALSKGSDTWQMRLGDFKDMMEQVLHEMYEFKVAVQQRAAAGSSFAGLGMGMMKRAPGR